MRRAAWSARLTTLTARATDGPLTTRSANPFSPVPSPRAREQGASQLRFGYSSGSSPRPMTTSPDRSDPTVQPRKLSYAQRARLERFNVTDSVDTHCHVIAGVDDGPATMDEALSLCRAL